MAETLQARLDFLQSQLHAISLALQQARGRGDAEAIAALSTLWKKVYGDIKQLQTDAYNADAPSQFMQTLAGIGDEALRVGAAIKDATVSVVGGLGAVGKYLPIILLAALVIVGLVYAGKIRKDLK